MDTVYAMDLETTTYDDYLLDGETRCYLWSVRNVWTDEEVQGESMEAWFEWMEEMKEDATAWFFNTSFDCRFITDWGLRHGYISENFEQVRNRKLAKKEAVKVYLDENDLPKYKVMEGGKKKPTYIPKGVTKAFEVPRRSMTMIKSGSKWIQLIIVNPKGRILRIYDIGNKYTTEHSLAGIAKAIGVKGKTYLDVLKRREPGYIATDEDRERVSNDTRIVAQAIKPFYEWGMTKPTLAGDAWKIYNDMLKEKFKAEGKEDDYIAKEIYPEIPERYVFKDGTEVNIRDAYFGGRVYLRPQYVEKEIEDVSNIDCNSMHPYQMRRMPMPYGKPCLSIDKPMTEHFIVSFTCVFKVKKGMDPTIQRNGSFRSIEAEWVYESDKAGETLTMTDIDLEEFLRHYDVEGWDFITKYYINFRTRADWLFNDYIDRFSKEKAEYKKLRDQYEEGSEEWCHYHMLYYRAKILMNALYGKFGQDPVKPYQWAELENDHVRVMDSDWANGEFFESPTKKYLPTAIFITAWSRKLLMDTFEKIPSAIYCDTDSVYYYGDVDVEACGVKLDKAELGAWDPEHVHEPVARFLRPKTYMIMVKKGEPVVKCGGMPDKVKQHVTWDNFHLGAVFGEETGKLLPRAVKGGVVLKPVTYRLGVR